MEMAKFRKKQNSTVDDMYNVGVDKFSNNKEKQQLQEQTKAGIDNLRQTTIDSSLSTASVRSDLTVEKTGLQYEKDIHSLVGFLSVVDNLLEEIKDTKKGITTRGLTKAGKKGMKESKFKLNQYEKQLKSKKKALLKQERAEIYDNDIANLRNSWQQVEKIREEIGIAQWGEYANIASYLYNSPEVAKESNKHQANDLEINQKFQEDLKDGAVLNIFNRNIQEANNFFRRIAQGEYKKADYQLYRTNYHIFNPICQKYGIRIPTNPNGGRISETVHTSVDYSNMDYGEAFQQGGLAGLIDKTLSYCKNMTPGQRNTWKTLGVLGIIGGVIYGQYKFYTNKNIGLGTKIGLTILPIFGSQFLTGKDPATLFKELLTGGLSIDELKNKFGNAIGGLCDSGSEAAQTTVPAMQSMMIFNPQTTAGELQQMTNTFMNDKNNKSRKNFYQQSCNKIQREGGTSARESFQAIFSENFDEEKRKKWLLSFGVTQSTNSTETVHNLAENANTNKVILEKFLSDNNLKITTNPSKKAELNTYIQQKNETNKSLETNYLKTHNERFIPINPQTNPNPQNPEQKGDKNIELKSNSLKTPVEKGLLKSFNILKGKCPKSLKGFLNKKLNKIKDGQSEEISKDIISHILKINSKSITIDISDNNIKQVYDKCFNRLYEDSGPILKPMMKPYNRNGLESNFKKRGLKGEKDKFDNRKNNLTVIFESIFGEIISYLQPKGKNIEIICHGQKFNTIIEAIKNLHIINPF